MQTEPEIKSENSTVIAIIRGTAPRPAQLAAARGILPLSQTDLLEVLVHLAANPDTELASASQETINSQDVSALRVAVETSDIAPSVLTYFADHPHFPKEIHEAIVQNKSIPDDAIVNLAGKTTNGNLIELILVNQQRLIRKPEILDAILANPSRTSEADRRARETRKEFFEKERGAQQIANEMRARGEDIAAEFIEQAEFIEDLAEAPEEGRLTIDDAILLASHIEVPDAEVDDSWLSLDLIEEIYEETFEQRQANANKILGELKADGDEVSGERISMIQKIMAANMKDRIKMAMKGDREMRTILIRDSNRIVASAVVQNSRITEQEIEKIAAMRTVPEEVLRQIANNRNWARNYSIVHNLARNPRTPISNVMSILTRLQSRDLQAMTKNRNVSDAIRKQALRLFQARAGR